MKKKIMVVDDDPYILNLMKIYLEHESYVVLPVSDSTKAMETFKSEMPEAVLLDIMMPVVNGFDLLRALRRISNVPVIMLSAKGETFDKVTGLELGADDYLVKPVDPTELMARIRAVFRRYNARTEDSRVLEQPGLQIDLDRFTVTCQGEAVVMPPKELELLYLLASHPNQVFTREQLLDKVWGFDYAGESRTVDVHIKRLREKLPGNDIWEIKTVWGVGYKFSV
ncbi:response regulator transcription factor [Acidaminobacter hydrogenoformans]|uniref:Stage 0 sporulation protein A homolog n=1 Tax=Acidaminobacter hydrogenoformans DSM 2784 TaxID=1120920 RepID=A0A1G5RTB1_9FIRM|nr:response regulator transcription factor [Acidaminobacter hydrogenoformans]SCZ77236.1 DNA-binding response regulator, OmpR family, contains REC and winged-helix (wHTH) domain [Acidaminobacter hydrogenoformans DSM 2784]